MNEEGNSSTPNSNNNNKPHRRGRHARGRGPRREHHGDRPVDRPDRPVHRDDDSQPMSMNDASAPAYEPGNMAAPSAPVHLENGDPSLPPPPPPVNPIAGKVLKLFELQQLTVPELVTMADEYGLRDLGALRKHELIFEILSCCAWAKNSEKHFILQPMTKIPTLRRALLHSVRRCMPCQIAVPPRRPHAGWRMRKTSRI